MEPPLLLLLSLLGLLSLTDASQITLKNAGFSIGFNGSTFALTQVSGVGDDSANRIAVATSSWWSAQFIIAGSSAVLTVDGSTAATRSHAVSPSGSSATFVWADIKLQGTDAGLADAKTVTVTGHADVASSGLELSVTFSTSSPGVALWKWSISVGELTVAADTASVRNGGFGVLEMCLSPSTCNGFASAYPQATYQFLALYNASSRAGGDGLYFAAHDGLAYSKTFAMAVAQRPGGRYATYSISGQPEGAGRTLTTYRTPYPVVVAPFVGDWWDASQLYRAWVLPNAQWTSRGPIAHRPDVPRWLLDLTTWVNSHWQGNDIFNISGGAPGVVLSRLSAITKRFALPSGLGLHWYEWDTLGYAYGSNYTNCTSEVTCGFDTHYPEYFPARQFFNQTVSELQQLGVRIAPYINGRIFDQGTASWRKEDGHCSSKKVPSFFNSTSYSYYEESYGSKAQFAVSCPHTEYWQNTISDVVGALVKQYGVDGVYIDQVAAAGPRNCWDPTHNHTLGGGHYWVSGYRTLLQSARSKAGNNAMLLTESNAEPFMDSINVFLTLVGFSGDFSGTSHIVPVFPAVYGGYYLSMGAEFFQEDLTVNPDVFAAKVAQQFMFGAQLGWFSLGGRNNQHPYMGMYDQLMSSEYDPEIAYIQMLSKGKTVANDWLQFGRRMRDLPLGINSTSRHPGPDTFARTSPPLKQRGGDVGHGHMHVASLHAHSHMGAEHHHHKHHHHHADRLTSGTTLGLSYSAVTSAAWLGANSSSLLIAVSTVERATPADVSIAIDMAHYGFPNTSPTGTFEVFDLFTGKPLGTYPRTTVQVNAKLSPRQLLLVKVVPT